MVKRIGIITAAHRQNLIGASTDEKPSDVGYGSIFIEDDTGNMFIFSGNENPETEDNWWPI